MLVQTKFKHKIIKMNKIIKHKNKVIVKIFNFKLCVFIIFVINYVSCMDGDINIKKCQGSNIYLYVNVWYIVRVFGPYYQHHLLSSYNTL